MTQLSRPESESNWLEKNKLIIGWTITGLIYGAGLYAAMKTEVNAINTALQVQEQRIKQVERRSDAFEVSLKEINRTLQQIDKNVVEIKTDLNYKKDK